MGCDSEARLNALLWIPGARRGRQAGLKGADRRVNRTGLDTRLHH